MPDFLHLSETLASRLCHDLAAPLGAIHTGLELLSQTQPSHLTEFNEILNLILQSTSVASSRATFFRAAFGASGRFLSLQEIKNISHQYLTHTRLNVVWNPCIDENNLKGWGRILLNLLLWLNECAPQGGILTVSFPTSDPINICFHLKGKPLVFHQGTLETLKGENVSQGPTPRTVSCYLARYLLDEIRASFVLNHISSSELQIEITK